MGLSCLSARQMLKPRFPSGRRKLHWSKTDLHSYPLPVNRRTYIISSETSNNVSTTPAGFLEDFKKFYSLEKPNFEIGTKIGKRDAGKKVVVAGWLVRRARLGKSLTFATFSNGFPRERNRSQELLPSQSKAQHKEFAPNTLQLVSRRGVSEAGDRAADALDDITLHSAVIATGVIRIKKIPPAVPNIKNKLNSWDSERETILPEIHLEKIDCVNSFPEDIIVGENKNYGSEARHLQIRFDPALQYRLLLRNKIQDWIRRYLVDFHETETPLLFKSTPEGAREFLVPTRKPGHAYALPQSPQQYKQMLMASGIPNYFQFAKCFRDEDFRADRQPEFTQVDLEMSWTDGDGVMKQVESLIRSIHRALNRLPPFEGHGAWKQPGRFPFNRVTYEQAMQANGSDKPDFRIPGQIHRIDGIIPSDAKSKLTSFQHPIIEVWKLRPLGSPRDSEAFIDAFMNSPDAAAFRNNPDGSPGVFIFDSSKPLEGLSVFGFEGAEEIKKFFSWLCIARNKRLRRWKAGSDGRPTDHDTETDEDVMETPESFSSEVEGSSLSEGGGSFADTQGIRDGDILFCQARKNEPFSGSSTVLGKLRAVVYKAAVAQGIIEAPMHFHYVWVTDFPLFTKFNNDDTDLGQGGSAGISSTHHPFTAPKTEKDVDLLLQNPLKARADHYDLVVDGVELGGGSRRIHNADMQAFIMRDILKMPESRIEEFSHLLSALRCGCPPHAGFALGLDRLTAILTGCDSIRDVLAFPKNSKGEDPFVGSPGLVTKEQSETYHLQIKTK